ncbi:MAG: hypothetical protein K2W99_04820 [Chthoniobacterales bacterium]|nr:hypothetical protein [Chthoniobacterales bacterium]
MSLILNLFYIDRLAGIMISLVAFIGILILIFARRYMDGDAKHGSFTLKLLSLVCVLAMLVSANHLLVFFVAWGVSNFLLVKLMIHKSHWKQAYRSGSMAGRNFFLGLIFLGCAFFCLYQVSGETSIQSILKISSSDLRIYFSAMFLIAAAMTQSAIWPFHRWLLSSLNSPTPVSALMHAGLVNGGGFLLARFAPLFLERPSLLNLVFTLGILTAFLGTLWKLMQPDVKKMLACSTMGQMGFMMAQCGLGLFAAAITHLCWHGLFKAYLFLSSPSAAQEKKYPFPVSKTWTGFLFSLFGGAAGAASFVFASHTPFSFDSTLILVCVAFIAGTQLSMVLLQNCLKNFPKAIAVSTLLGGCYGLNILVAEKFLAPLSLFQPQPMNPFYLVGLFVLIVSWLWILRKSATQHEEPSTFWLRSYVANINASQPAAETITNFRNDYQYK